MIDYDIRAFDISKMTELALRLIDDDYTEDDWGTFIMALILYRHQIRDDPLLVAALVVIDRIDKLTKPHYLDGVDQHAKYRKGALSQALKLSKRGQGDFSRDTCLAYCVATFMAAYSVKVTPATGNDATNEFSLYDLLLERGITQLTGEPYSPTMLRRAYERCASNLDANMVIPTHLDFFLNLLSDRSR